MTVRTMKRGDLWPPLIMRIRYADAALVLTEDIDVSTPAYVTVCARHSTEPIVDKAPGVVTTPSPGLVEVAYEWAPGDTDLPGEYLVEVEFLVDGRPVTAPSKGAERLVIQEDLD